TRRICSEGLDRIRHAVIVTLEECRAHDVRQVIVGVNLLGMRIGTLKSRKRNEDLGAGRTLPPIHAVDLNLQIGRSGGVRLPIKPGSPLRMDRYPARIARNQKKGIQVTDFQCPHHCTNVDGIHLVSPRRLDPADRTDHASSETGRCWHLSSLSLRGRNGGITTYDLDRFDPLHFPQRTQKTVIRLRNSWSTRY